MNPGRPWMTALEMQFAALDIGLTLKASSDPRLDNYKRTFLTCNSLLRRADAYAWSPEIFSAVRTAADSLPDDVAITADMLPSNVAWWWLGDTPFISKWGDDYVGIKALLIASGQDHSGCPGVAFWGFALSDKRDPPAPFPACFWTWKYGESYADMMTRHDSFWTARNEAKGDMHNVSKHLSRFMVAGCCWLHQRVLSVADGHIERHRRKQLAREYGAKVTSGVKVIQLRRSASLECEQGDDTNRNAEWSCRWIVNGHWRNQPYKDSRKLIFIMPYVKGPDDKPLKVAKHTVYSVSR